MKRIFVATLVFWGMALGASVHADSYYRINLRAYRRMMHWQGPHPLADRFLGFLDRSVLQPNGPADQAFNQLVQRFIQQNQKNTANGAADSQTAQRPVLIDQDLLGADAKVRAMTQKLGITYVTVGQSQNTQSIAPQLTGGFDPNLAIPAPAPPQGTFVPPAAALPPKP